MSKYDRLGNKTLTLLFKNVFFNVCKKMNETFENLSWGRRSGLSEN